MRARDGAAGRVTALRSGALILLVGAFAFGAVELSLAASTVAASRDTTQALSSGAAISADASGATTGQRAGPVSHSSPQPTATRTPVTTLTISGSSVMVASTPALDQAIPGMAINAVVGRQFSIGLQVLASLKAQGLLRPVVVFALGTNGTVTASEISQLFAEIGPHRRLVLVNTFEARPWEHEVNSILAAAARDHPGVTLANWYATIEHRTNLLWPDGIHPQPAGGVVYAAMLRAALDRVINLPG